MDDRAFARDETDRHFAAGERRLDTIRRGRRSGRRLLTPCRAFPVAGSVNSCHAKQASTCSALASIGARALRRGDARRERRFVWIGNTGEVGQPPASGVRDSPSRPCQSQRHMTPVRTFRQIGCLCPSQAGGSLLAYRKTTPSPSPPAWMTGTPRQLRELSLDLGRSYRPDVVDAIVLVPETPPAWPRFGHTNRASLDGAETDCAGFSNY